MTMTHDELRKLAEAARDAKLADKHHQGLLESSTTQAIWADFYTAANPKTVLELLDEIADLRISVVAFLGPHAAWWAEANGKPNYLHPQHYDLLEKCGARMVDFKRYEAKP